MDYSAFLRERGMALVWACVYKIQSVDTLANEFLVCGHTCVQNQDILVFLMAYDCGFTVFVEGLSVLAPYKSPFPVISGNTLHSKILPQGSPEFYNHSGSTPELSLGIALH